MGAGGILGWAGGAGVKSEASRSGTSGSSGEACVSGADGGSAGEDQLACAGDGSGWSQGGDCGSGWSQGGDCGSGWSLGGEGGPGRLQEEPGSPGEDSGRLQEDTGPGRSQGEDGDSGRKTGGNNDSGGPDGVRDPDEVPGKSADSAGWARVANGLRVLMLKPHASQNGPEAAVPHRGQTSARGNSARPGTRCLPAVSGPAAGPAPTRAPQTSQTSSLAESWPFGHTAIAAPAPFGPTGSTGPIRPQVMRLGRTATWIFRNLRIS